MPAPAQARVPELAAADGVPALPAASFYLPAKSHLRFQDAQRGGNASVAGPYTYAPGYGFGQPYYRAVSSTFPNAVVTEADEADLPTMAQNNINMVFARFPEVPGESEDAFRTRVDSYLDAAARLNMRVVFGAEWHFASLLQVREPLRLSYRSNTASKLRAGKYEFMYTYSGYRPDGSVGESSTWPIPHQSLALSDSGSGSALTEVVVRTPEYYVDDAGAFLPSVAGWNVYVRAPSGYYVRQNDAPIQTRSTTLTSITTAGCDPSSGVLARCLPPYNNTLSPDIDRIRQTVALVDSHPNVFGYWIMDEPNSVGASVPQMREIYAAWRRYTRKALVVNFTYILASFGNDFPTGDGVANNPFATGVCDVCVMEMYPQQQLGPYVYWKQRTGISKFLRVVNSAYGIRKKPVIWAMPQAHVTDSPVPFSYLKRLDYAGTYRQASDLVDSGVSGLAWYVWRKQAVAPDGGYTPAGLVDNPSALRAVRDFGARIQKQAVIVAPRAATLNLPAGSRVYAPAAGHIGPNQGTVSFWMSPTGWYGDDGRAHVLFSWAGPGTKAKLVIEKRADNRLAWALTRNTGAATTWSAATGSKLIPQREPSIYRVSSYPDTLYHFALTWGGGWLRLYMNGRLLGSAALSSGMGAAPPSFYFGADYNGAKPAPGRYSDISTFSFPLTKAQITALAAMAPAASQAGFPLTITSPAADAIVSGTAATYIRAVPDPSVRLARLYVDGANVSSTSVFPYALTWNTKAYLNGYHTLAVRLERWDGTTQTSSLRRVRVYNTAP